MIDNYYPGFNLETRDVKENDTVHYLEKAFSKGDYELFFNFVGFRLYI